jgi:hypothetical protein
MKRFRLRTRAFLEPGTELVIVVELVSRRLVDDVMECERPWDDFAFGRYPGDQLVEVGCERVQVVNSLQRSRLNCNVD